MNWEAVLELLEVEEATRNHPNLRAIHDEAIRQLNDYNKELLPEEPEKPELVEEPSEDIPEGTQEPVVEEVEEEKEDGEGHSK